MTQQAYTFIVSYLSEEDISYNFDLVSKLDLIINNTYSIILSLTCSISGSTIVSYSLSTTSGSVPSWVSLDTTNWKLIINTTNVPAGTTASFTIDASVTGDTKTYQKTVNLAIINWDVSNCAQWDPSSSNVCKVWTTSSQTINGNTQVSSKSKFLDFLSLLTLVTAGTIILLESLSGICSCSPFQLVWVVINHNQILLLLMLCNAYFPDDILNFMKKLASSSFSMNILNLDQVSIYKKINEALDYSVYRTNLDYFEINSGSSIINHYSFYSTLIVNVVMHLLFILIF